MTMLLPKFELHQPTTVDEAVALMKQFGDDFDFISGGTDLLPNYKCGLNSRKNVISLAHIDELKQIDATTIGAGVTLTEIEHNSDVPAGVRLGRCKPPVAAGRGSGGHAFSVEPGAPERSILIHRMRAQDPGERMPELGRSVPDEAGIALVSAWIEGLPGRCGRDGAGLARR